MDECDEALRDRIYEAAMIPEMWSANCDLISAQVGAYSMALMSISTEGDLRAVSSPHIAEPLAVFLQSDLPFQNIRVKRQMETGEGGFLRDVDIMTADEIGADPIYNAFLRPRGLGWTAGAVFQEPSGSTLIFDFLRKHELGAFSSAEITKLNRLKSDLARASFMTTRLGFQEAKSVTGAMAALGLPAAVLSVSGRCVDMNGGLEALAPRIRTGWGNRLQFQNAEANRLFQASLLELKHARSPEVLSLPVAAGEHTPPLVVHLVPIRRNARDIFSSGAVVMIVTAVAIQRPPNLSVISGLFDLTRAEARIARELASGRSADEVARSLNVSVNTLRTHTKSIFRKTGVKRQSELTALLSGLALPLV